MIIEIRGTGFANKGAELMLAAIVDWLGQTLPEASLVVRPDVGPYQRRARYGLLQVFEPRRAGRLGWVLERLMHGGYRKRYGLVREVEIDVVLDASGYSLGDPWPRWAISQTAAYYERARAKGVMVVLLPQAIGPLEDTHIAEATRRVLLAADLVFAREQESLAHANRLVPEHTALRQAPDFTCLLPPVAPAAPPPGPRPVCIVPNAQMLRHGSEAIQQAYVPFLVACARHVRSLGATPFILLHEEKADDAIGERVAAEEGGGLQVVRETDARCLKGMIAACELMIGSRFHGLVSALSQGVPAIGTSWSHKYQLLFEDYGRPEWLVDPVAGLGGALALIDQLLESQEGYSRSLKEAASRQKSLAEGMWSEVVSRIQGGPSV